MIDKKDQKILNVLKKNSRQTIKEISKKTKIRPSTVHLRINKLVENKVIEKFTVKTNDEILKENFVVYILVNTEKEIPDSVFKNEKIKEVYGITGEYDLTMKCKFSGINEFNKFILDFRKIPQVKNTVTMIGTVKIKSII
ncbi:winged helix-turn-helix transcriptional regulator [Candidatus Woesearchaeota archaeon]|nr:winged helix-turn-helix transcriptional regulator [Candidatus Woesearchaeota archaeon]